MSKEKSVTIAYTLTLNADGSTATLTRGDGKRVDTISVNDALLSLRPMGLVIEMEGEKLGSNTLTMRHKAGGDYAWSPGMTKRVVDALDARLPNSKITVENEPVK